MQDREWSRSRYWLCHFLQNRHERVTIPWQDPSSDGDERLNASVAHWLRWISETNAPARQRLISWAVTDCASDPAYIQSMRLFVKEEEHHAATIARYLTLRRLTAPEGGFTRAAVRAMIKPLGLRFELSILLLSEIAVITMNRLLLAKTGDGALRWLLTQMVHDHQCHLAFHSERLTTEFADFNFVRRNLRRLRLRVMFAMAVKGITCYHRPLLKALDCPPRQFASQCAAGFRCVLERMVPYRRDALMARLLDQRENPYAKALAPFD